MATAIGTQGTTRIILQESYGIAKSFPTDATLKSGVVVKLGTTGKVSAASLTDRNIGIVTVGNDGTKSIPLQNKVTVLTPFKAVSNAVASGAVTAGNELAADGVDSDGVQKWKVAVATNVIVGIALTTAANEASLQIGVLKQGELKA